MLAIVGNAGAGKTTAGREIARRWRVPFEDTDELLTRAMGVHGHDVPRERVDELRRVEAEVVVAALRRGSVVAVGAGAVESESVRAVLRGVPTAHLEVGLDEGHRRVASRPLYVFRDRDEYAARHASRAPLYDAVSSHRLVWAPGVHPTLIGPRDERVVGFASRHRARLEVADARVNDRGAEVVLRGGERLKDLWHVETLLRRARDLPPDGVLVATGGGTVTDLVGLVASLRNRGAGWVAVPTTLVGQLDAAIGGKVAVSLHAKNDVGAVHEPLVTICDPARLETLPARERSHGLVEALRTALVTDTVPAADDADLVDGIARAKVALIARGDRHLLQLGHVAGHAIEHVTGRPHGEAVGLGLLAELALDGNPARDHVEGLLASWGLPTHLDPRPPEAALLEALRRDKGRDRGVRIVTRAEEEGWRTRAFPEAAVPAMIP